MTRLMFVGDGPLDEAAVPPLVEGILGCEVERSFRSWKGIRVHRGYGSKLRFAARVAEQGHDGLVATVDQDREKAGRRLRVLAKARETERGSSTFPMAIGEARPHLEAWLLDDDIAVREALGLPGQAKIPSPRNVHPKETLLRLLNENPRSGEQPVAVWRDLARAMEVGRCRRAKSTGLKAFAADVEAELRPAVDA